RRSLARYPQTGDFITNVSARPGDEVLGFDGIFSVNGIATSWAALCLCLLGSYAYWGRTTATL
ncbi:MAG: hypothetical protein ACREYF_12810, partial [Gammaproteobacteria bacterium]